MILLVPLAALGQEAPFTIDGDQITYEQSTQQVEATGNVRIQYRSIRLMAEYALVDLAKGQLAARGHVVLVDAKGRELRGDALMYNVKTDEAEIISAQAFIDRVYIRSDRLQTRQGLVIAENVTLTTCNPDRPAYRITASRIELTPGDRLVAHGASLWLGGTKLFTLPTYSISLRSAAETARTAAPRLGYNNVDGTWIGYEYPYRWGPLDGTLFGKYALKTQLSLRNTLQYRAPIYTLAFTAGRNQNPDLLVYDELELAASLSRRPVGRSPLSVFGAASGGWYREPATGAESARLQAEVGIVTDRFPLGLRSSWGASISYLQAVYGVGGQQGVLRINADLGYALSDRTVIDISYTLVQVTGSSPFLFDSIPVIDQAHKVAVTMTQSGVRLGQLDTQIVVGTGYSFRDSSVIYTAGFLAMTPGHVSFGVQASYLARTGVYTDIDYVVAAQICDCLQALLRYRQVRQEIWFELGLIAIPEAQVQLQFPKP